MPASPPTPGWSTRGETRPSPSGERESAQLAQLRDRQRDTSLLQHPGYQIRPSRTGGRDRWEQEQIRFSEVVNLCLRCGLHQEARLQTAREASPKEPPSGLWAPPAPCLPCPHLLNSQNGSLYMLLRARCGERLGDTHRKQTHKLELQHRFPEKERLPTASLVPWEIRRRTSLRILPQGKWEVWSWCVHTSCERASESIEAKRGGGDCYLKCESSNTKRQET